VSRANGCRAERDALEERLGTATTRALGATPLVGSRARAGADVARPRSRPGIELDCSLGFNDAVGFRRGISVPFRPFDRETVRATRPPRSCRRSRRTPHSQPRAWRTSSDDSRGSARACEGPLVLD
jgi:hypothetical protein